MITALLAAATLGFPCPALDKGVRFEVGRGVEGSVRQTTPERFELGVAGGRLSVSGECQPDFAEQVLVADFNFDGWRDVAVPTGVGYGGVNYFYGLYLYQPAERRFVPSGADEVGNPEPDPVTRTVSAPYKSGPAYAVATLCPIPDGHLYRCRLGEIGTNGVAAAADDYDWQWFDQRGRVVLALPLRRSGEDRSMWKVQAIQAILRRQPGAVNQRPYLVRGDRVEVLEFRGEWAHVSYTDRKDRAFAGWVLRAELQQP